MKTVFTKQYGNFLSTVIAARKNAGLTQNDIARRLGRPQSFVSKYERGERRLDVIEFIAIAQVIGMSASDVIKELERQLQTDIREDR